LKEKVAAPVKKTVIMAVGICHADHATPLYPQKLTLTSPTSSSRSVSMVCSRTKAMDFSSIQIMKPFFVQFSPLRYFFGSDIFSHSSFFSLIIIENNSYYTNNALLLYDILSVNSSTSVAADMIPLCMNGPIFK
jgi:hypothetical protein